MIHRHFSLATVFSITIISACLFIGMQYASTHAYVAGTNKTADDRFTQPMPTTIDPYAQYRNMSDGDVVNAFSKTFLAFDATKCHFTNNQGLNSRGVFHDGYDFNCLPLNTPFLVTLGLPVEIKETGEDPLYGNYIIASDLTKRFTFIFGHLSALYVKTGDITSLETPAFKTGTTGNSTGVHLHVEILKNGFPTQLSDSIFSTYKTIYKKTERAPLDVLVSILALTKEQAKDQILNYVSNGYYPLNWYKIISLAEYHHTSFLGFLNQMKDYPITDYYQFATYFIKQYGLTKQRDRAKELIKIRVYLYAFERTQFMVDKVQEVGCEEAEKDFKEWNKKDYPNFKRK